MHLNFQMLDELFKLKENHFLKMLRPQRGFSLTNQKPNHTILSRPKPSLISARAYRGAHWRDLLLCGPYIEDQEELKRISEAPIPRYRPQRVPIHHRSYLGFDVLSWDNVEELLDTPWAKRTAGSKSFGDNELGIDLELWTNYKYPWVDN
jgi:hypothetical protein